jgi:hypothetical protein
MIVYCLAVMTLIIPLVYWVVTGDDMVEDGWCKMRAYFNKRMIVKDHG